MATPKTLQVYVNYDDRQPQVVTFGTDPADAGQVENSGTIKVWPSDDTTIQFNIVTVHSAGDAAQLQQVQTTPDPLPGWLTSQLPLGGANPALIFVASGGKVTDSIRYTLWVGPPGVPPTQVDPTIINVDPP